jgi:amidohydrolase family protein
MPNPGKSGGKATVSYEESSCWRVAGTLDTESFASIRSRHPHGAIAEGTDVRKIDAFAHILPPSYARRLESIMSGPVSDRVLGYEPWIHEDPVLTSLDARWRVMDAFDDYIQGLTLAVPPPAELGDPAMARDLARAANDELAGLVRDHPDRFAGFSAALPMNDIDAAVEELDRVITHHAGAMVPHFAGRLASPLEDPDRAAILAGLDRDPMDYFRGFYADTAMFGATHAVRCAVEFFGADHVLFGTDMPLGGPSVVGDTIADIEALDLPDADAAAIFGENARRVLRIPA